MNYDDYVCEVWMGRLPKLMWELRLGVELQIFEGFHACGACKDLFVLCLRHAYTKNLRTHELRAWEHKFQSCWPSIARLKNLLSIFWTATARAPHVPYLQREAWKLSKPWNLLKSLTSLFWQAEVTAAIMAARRMVDPAIFEHLQSKIDEDTSFRDVCASVFTASYDN